MEANDTRKRFFPTNKYHLMFQDLEVILLCFCFFTIVFFHCDNNCFICNVMLLLKPLCIHMQWLICNKYHIHYHEQNVHWQCSKYNVLHNFCKLVFVLSASLRLTPMCAVSGTLFLARLWVVLLDSGLFRVDTVWHFIGNLLPFIVICSNLKLQSILTSYTK